MLQLPVGGLLLNNASTDVNIHDDAGKDCNARCLPGADASPDMRKEVHDMKHANSHSFCLAASAAGACAAMAVPLALQTRTLRWGATMPALRRRTCDVHNCGRCA